MVNAFAIHVSSQSFFLKRPMHVLCAMVFSFVIPHLLARFPRADADQVIEQNVVES